MNNLDKKIPSPPNPPKAPLSNQDIFICTMIRFARHNNKDYVIVDTNFIIYEGQETLEVPIHIRIDTTNVSKDQNLLVFKKAALLFNRSIIIKKQGVIAPKKSWWTKLFKNN